MKYLVLGDIHGRSLDKLSEIIEREKPEILLCTSDFDRVEQVNQYRKIVGKFNWEKALTVPGNHDDAVYNNQEIQSADLQRMGLTVNQLHVNLMRDSQASKFLAKILKSDTREFEINGLDSVLIHGAFNGDLSSYPACPEEKRNYWFRLRNKDDHRKNFEQMQEKGLKVMIRGHDHEPEYAYLRNGEVHRDLPQDEEDYLLKDKPVTITHGAWKNGWYTVLEKKEEGVQVKFRKLED